MVVFVIVGKSDPLYEVELGSNGKEDLAYLSQFILHSSLDMVDNIMWTNSSTFLKVVDRFNSLVVSAYVTPGGLYLLLLHEGRSEDAVRGFFTEIHELYVKYMLNPFAVYDGPISSPLFDARVRASARKFFAI